MSEYVEKREKLRREKASEDVVKRTVDRRSQAMRWQQASFRSYREGWREEKGGM